MAGIERLFLAHFSPAELEQLAGLLGRLPGASLRRCLHRRTEAADTGGSCSVA